MDELTPKQEAFCLCYFETGNGAQAYRQAYDVEESARDNWIYVEACQLLDNPKIALRVKQLQEQAEDLSFYTVRSALDELEEARKLAHSEKSAGAAVSAVMGKIKLFGLEAPARSKVEVNGKVAHTISATPLTPEQWAEQHAGDE